MLHHFSTTIDGQVLNSFNGLALRGYAGMVKVEKYTCANTILAHIRQNRDRN